VGIGHHHFYPGSYSFFVLLYFSSLKFCLVFSSSYIFSSLVCFALVKIISLVLYETD